jgi:hypothetical protein
MSVSRPLSVDVDPAATRRRRERLQEYVASNLLERQRFICGHKAACSKSRIEGDVFRPGIMSHLGRRFDLRLGGKDLRVVVVGQEPGLPSGPDARRLGSKVSLDDRYTQVRTESGLNSRYYADAGYRARNPHMRGTTSALRIIFGHGLGSDDAGEWITPVHGHAFHIFDGFALVNRLLCSAGPEGGSRGRSTTTMRDNCLEHFEATLAILDPTLVVLQGALVAKSSTKALPVDRELSPYLYESRGASGRRLMVCRFSHPAARGLLRWGDRLDVPYLNDVVVPTLRQAVTAL